MYTCSCVHASLCMHPTVSISLLVAAAAATPRRPGPADGIISPPPVPSSSARAVRRPELLKPEPTLLPPTRAAGRRSDAQHTLLQLLVLVTGVLLMRGVRRALRTLFVATRDCVPIARIVECVHGSDV